MGLRFHRFDPQPCGFPRPNVPVLPPLQWRQLTLRATPSTRQVRHFARGRYALRAAYAAAGVGPGGSLLAPAYHCRTMLDPAIELGAEVLPYALTPDLHADLQGIKRAASRSRTPVAALLLTHYFGLPRETAPVAEWCRQHGITLVEDCSHAWVDADSPGLGGTGSYAVSSPYKFVPCPDGGLLWTNGERPLPPPEPGRRSARSELGACMDSLRQALRHPVAPEPAALDDTLQALAPRLQLRGRDWIDEQQPLSSDYVATDAHAPSLWVSRWLQQHVDLGQLKRARQQRYRQWAAAVDGLAGCRALLPALPPGCTPYMFPLLVTEPERRFYPLKQLGVPIWRWDDMAESDCAVSARYRQGVFHLPCHQSLSDGQMAWLTAAVARVMAS